MNNQIPTRTFEPIEPRRSPLGWILLIIGILILIGVVVFFITRPAEKAEEAAPIEIPGLTARVVFASVINDDYTYSVQPSAVYVKGSPVYIYVEANNIKKENSIVDVTEDLEIKDSNGKTIFGEKAFGSLKQATVEEEPAAKFRNIIPTAGWDVGAYALTIKINDNIAEKSVTKTLEFSIKEKEAIGKNLSFVGPLFATFIDEEYNYESQPNSVYSIGDTVYAYMVIMNLEQPLVDGKYNVKFTEDVAVLDEDGNIIASQEGYLTVDDLNDLKQDNYNIKNVFATGGLLAGKYVYKATVKDLNTGQEAVKQGVFYLE